MWTRVSAVQLVLTTSQLKDGGHPVFFNLNLAKN